MPVSRIVIWVAVVAFVLYDIVAALLGWSTISAQVRVCDTQTSGLFRWLLLGLWLHFFVMARWP
jgi:uncharacterized membrane protein YuzA (DUF378 family)